LICNIVSNAYYCGQELPATFMALFEVTQGFHLHLYSDYTEVEAAAKRFANNATFSHITDATINEA